MAKTVILARTLSEGRDMCTKLGLAPNAPEVVLATPRTTRGYRGMRFNDGDLVLEMPGVRYAAGGQTLVSMTKHAIRDAGPGADVRWERPE